MELFIIRQNIEHYKAMLKIITDPAQRRGDREFASRRRSQAQEIRGRSQKAISRDALRRGTSLGQPLVARCIAMWIIRFIVRAWTKNRHRAVLRRMYRLLTEGRARIERQRAIIARLEQLGIDCAKQRALLTRMLEAQDQEVKRAAELLDWLQRLLVAPPSEE